jgi:hypothetical protein
MDAAAIVKAAEALLANSAVRGMATERVLG